jgi:hypothetical protein
MKKTLATLALFLFAAAAFAHAGHVHTYMGTVTMVHDDGSFMMTTKDGANLTVTTSAATTYEHADGTAAKRADLAEGMRIVVKMAVDGKTATSVKMAK